MSTAPGSPLLDCDIHLEGGLPDAPAREQVPCLSPFDTGQVRDVFLDWYATRHDDVSEEAGEAADTILGSAANFVIPVTQGAR